MDFESEYICECENLLYQDVKTREDFCLNPKCNKFVNQTIKNDTRILEDQFKKEETKLSLELLQFSKERLIDFLFVTRENLLQNYLLNVGMDIQAFYTINRLLMKINNTSFHGRTKSEKKFSEFLTKFTKHTYELNFADDIMNGIYALTDSHTLIIKYSKVFTKLFENYGITNQKRLQQGTTFRYIDIDIKNDFEQKYQEGTDLIEYYKRFYRLMVSINYFLNYHYKQSFYFKYEFTKQDTAFLLSIFYSIEGSIMELSSSNFKKHLIKNNPDTTSHRTFIYNLAENPEIVPIFFRKNHTFLFGKMTSLFFAFYIMGVQAKNIMQEGKEIASVVFEDEIRQELRKKDYYVPFDKEFSLYKNSYSYDIIAISDNKKKVFLIEAKYKDISPSSMNGKTLINQELMGEKGLIAVSDKQNERLNFFKEHITDFSTALNKNIEDYSLNAFIITKFDPLISKRKEVILSSSEEFFGNFV